jgi:hypothetical protein
MKMHFNDMVWGCALDLSSSGCGSLTSSCGQNNKPFVSLKGRSS